jgi:hypothetical protein
VVAGGSVVANVVEASAVVVGGSVVAIMVVDQSANVVEAKVDVESSAHAASAPTHTSANRALTIDIFASNQMIALIVAQRTLESPTLPFDLSKKVSRPPRIQVDFKANVCKIPTWV